VKHVRFVLPQSGRPNSEINVTPLVDVVLVLLIIFMVVTPLLEKKLEVRVPDTEELPPDIEIPQDQIVVQLDEQSALTINSQPVAGKDYVAELTRDLAGKSPGNRLVFFYADDKASYATLVSVLDGAKQAGADTLGMITAPPFAKPAAPAAPQPATQK
jgi:biopolymer transport protein ExbD/biopolymer transport protein TolR